MLLHLGPKIVLGIRAKRFLQGVAFPVSKEHLPFDEIPVTTYVG